MMTDRDPMSDPVSYVNLLTHRKKLALQRELKLE